MLLDTLREEVEVIRRKGMEVSRAFTNLRGTGVLGVTREGTEVLGVTGEGTGVLGVTREGTGFLEVTTRAEICL